MEDDDWNAKIQRKHSMDQRRGRKLGQKFARLAAKVCCLNNDALKEFNRVTDNIGTFLGADAVDAKDKDADQDRGFTRN